MQEEKKKRGLKNMLHSYHSWARGMDLHSQRSTLVYCIHVVSWWFCLSFFYSCSMPVYIWAIIVVGSLFSAVEIFRLFFFCLHTTCAFRDVYVRIIFFPLQFDICIISEMKYLHFFCAEIGGRSCHDRSFCFCISDFGIKSANNGFIVITNLKIGNKY